MADPRRYYIEPIFVLDAGQHPVQSGISVQESPSGDWIKWHDFEDYKAAQRRNASAEMNERLGIEIAKMRVLIEEMNNTINISQAKCRELKAENERLREAGDAVVAAYCAGDTNVEKWKEYPVVREWLAAKGVHP